MPRSQRRCDEKGGHGRLVRWAPRTRGCRPTSHRYDSTGKRPGEHYSFRAGIPNSRVGLQTLLSVIQKVIDGSDFPSYNKSVANVLPRDKQIAVVSALVEGCSIRATERMTGVNRETVGTLLVRAGNACADLLDEKMQNLNCTRLELESSARTSRSEWASVATRG